MPVPLVVNELAVLIAFATPSRNVPAETVVRPVYVFKPERINVPVPVLLKPMVAVEPAMTAPMLADAVPAMSKLPPPTAKLIVNGLAEPPWIVRFAPLAR